MGASLCRAGGAGPVHPGRCASGKGVFPNNVLLKTKPLYPTGPTVGEEEVLGTIDSLLAGRVSFRCTSVDPRRHPRLRPGAALRGRCGEVPPQPGLPHTVAGCAW
jgi:hypothetical protein